MSSLSKKKLPRSKIFSFQDFVWDFYHRCGRSFAWRNTNNTYHVVVSEIMLQQTQTHRVVQKYEEFIAAFPNFESLADASLRDVLSVWQGLGYNRRAQYLQKTAQKVVCEYNGQLPDNPQELETFPGIGKYTAGSICAFAFNKPIVFIETNIRTVFIHTFFPKQDRVKDADICYLVEKTLDYDNPRAWYYALMDYGVWLKKQHPNPSRKSAHYAKQSKFEGSDRQIRGQIIRLLAGRGSIAQDQLFTLLGKEQKRIKDILSKLIRDGLIEKNDNKFHICRSN